MSTMTLAQIRAMFEVGQIWDAVNTYNPKANGPRRLLEKHTKDFVWAMGTIPRGWMPFPKATEIVEAGPGRLTFRIRDRDGTVTLTRAVAP